MLELVGIVPTWMRDAACARPGIDPELFFPHVGKNSLPDTKEVRRFCGHCPVKNPCAEYAFTNDIEHGIWGGLTDRARRSLRGRVPTPRASGVCRRCGEPSDKPRSQFCGDDCRTAHRREYNRAYQAAQRSAS